MCDKLLKIPDQARSQRICSSSALTAKKQEDDMSELHFEFHPYLWECEVVCLLLLFPEVKYQRRQIIW